MNKKNKWVKKRHVIIKTIIKPIVDLFVKIFYKYSHKKEKIDQNQNYFIISNHQTALDPIFISLSFKKPVYFLATDFVMNKGFLSKLLRYCFAPIGKRKGISDASSIKNILKVVKENGTVAIFPEGNRSYAEFLFNIDVSLAKLIKVCKLPLVIFNLSGGFGVSPRFANKNRKGKIHGYIKKVISYEEYSQISDEQLLEIIKNEITVFDSDNNKQYNGSHRAEYLERMLFVCPKCNKTQTLYSKNNFIKCSSCDLLVEYTPYLKLKSNDKKFSFTRLIDWYDYQKRYCLNYDISNNIIFNDEKIVLKKNGKKSIKERLLYLANN